MPAMGPRICLSPVKLGVLRTLCIWVKLSKAKTANAVLANCTPSSKFSMSSFTADELMAPRRASSVTLVITATLRQQMQRDSGHVKEQQATAENTSQTQAFAHLHCRAAYRAERPEDPKSSTRRHEPSASFTLCSTRTSWRRFRESHDSQCGSVAAKLVYTSISVAAVSGTLSKRCDQRARWRSSHRLTSPELSAAVTPSHKRSVTKP